jgi:hypothetical protein
MQRYKNIIRKVHRIKGKIVILQKNKGNIEYAENQLD